MSRLDALTAIEVGCLTGCTRATEYAEQKNARELRVARFLMVGALAATA
jgi:hypothetical protein